MIRKFILLTLIAASALSIAAACSDDDGEAASAAMPTGAAEATSAPSPTAAAEATSAPSPTATAASSDPEAEALATLDGLVCTGGWENLTFSSTGSVELTFDIVADAGGGTLTMEIGGNIFGAEGGTVSAPFTRSGSVITAQAELGVMGTLTAVFEDGELREATFDAPPVLGSAANVVVSTSCSTALNSRPI